MDLGKVLSVKDGIVIVSGIPTASIGEILNITSDTGRNILCMVLSLNLNDISAVLLEGNDTNIREGLTVTPTGKLFSIRTGGHLLGHVVDPFGHYLDSPHTLPNICVADVSYQAINTNHNNANKHNNNDKPNKHKQDNIDKPLTPSIDTKRHTRDNINGHNPTNLAQQGDHCHNNTDNFDIHMDLNKNIANKPLLFIHDNTYRQNNMITNLKYNLELSSIYGCPRILTRSTILTLPFKPLIIYRYMQRFPQKPVKDIIQTSIRNYASLSGKGNIPKEYDTFDKHTKKTLLKKHYQLITDFEFIYHDKTEITVYQIGTLFTKPTKESLTLSTTLNYRSQCSSQQITFFVKPIPITTETFMIYRQSESFFKLSEVETILRENPHYITLREQVKKYHASQDIKYKSATEIEEHLTGLNVLLQQVDTSKLKDNDPKMIVVPYISKNE